MVFKKYFQNSNKGQMVSRLFNEVGHCLRLRSSLNHLSGERRENYIIIVLHQILEFLHV
jgi:hypothetical protein